MSNTLYVWADVTDLGIGDHTWISTYNPATGEPDSNKGDYWYCGGGPHDNATLLDEGSGGINFAQNLARSNDKDELVGIVYLADGVCHQMANRLLRFSLNKNNNTATVEGANGYKLSKVAYGIYGEKTKRKKSVIRFKKWEETVRNYEISGR